MTPAVIQVNWVSRVAEEAVLVVSDEFISVRVYCQPCSLHEGDFVEQPLLAFDSQHVARSEEHVHRATPVGEFACEFCGTVRDVASRLVHVGQIRIVLDVSIPGDIVVGENICFTCARLDYLG